MPPKKDQDKPKVPKIVNFPQSRDGYAQEALHNIIHQGAITAPNSLDRSRSDKNIRKIGRNSPCPCGSGKKFKVCCINNESEPKRDPLVDEVLLISDPRLEELKVFLRDPSGRLSSHKVLADVGAELGSLDYPKLGKAFLQRALDKQPKNHGYSLNMAVMIDQLGDHEEALKILQSVPEGFGRKTVIEANIKSNICEWSDIKGLYEKAAREEPDFYLPYYQLTANSPLNSEARLFWAETGFAHCKTDPVIAIQWCLIKFSRRDFQDIINDPRLSHLKDQSGDASIIGQRLEDPKFINSIEIIKDASRMLFNEDPSRAHSIANKLSTLHAMVKCTVARGALEFVSNFGLPELVPDCLGQVCNDCAKDISEAELKFAANRFGGEYSEAIKIAKEILKEDVTTNVKTDFFYVDYIDCLDETEGPKAAFEQGLLFEEHISQYYTKARYYWDMGYYASRLGEWKATSYFLDKFSDCDLEALLNINIPKRGGGDEEPYFFSSIFHLQFNRALCLLAERKFIEFDNFLNGISDKPIGAYQYIPEEFEYIRSELIELNGAAREFENSNDYQNKFQNLINKSQVFNAWGGKIKPLSNTQKISEMLKLYESKSLPERVEALRQIHRIELRERDDFSDIINNIEGEIPNIKIIPNDALASLIEAESRFKVDFGTLDASPTILAYTKAIELTLRKLIFQKYRTEIFYKIKQYCEDAKSDENFNQFKGLVRFLSSGRIELGTIRQVILLSSGKTSGRVELLSSLHKFIKLHFPLVLEETFLEDLENVTNNFRNEAVHERQFSTGEANHLRKLVYGLFKAVMNPRLIEN